ncbi:MAG TPA: hypothetical protein VFY69_00430, partial [Solirubrobacterales bacterium]|nr:hypothetical protein [Solirubrobacterales bacterium]
GAKSRERAEEFADGIRKRIADLGWTEARFGEVDRSIGSAERRRETDPRLERYKEKYARIAFFESVGRLSDAGELFTSASSNYRLGRMPIDPSFPRDARPLPLRLAPWVLNGGPDERWVREARTEVPNHLLRHQFAEADDTWVAIDGFLRHGPAELGRQAHCSVRGVLALGSWRTVDAYLTLAGIDAGTVPESFEDNYCFTGESPWSPTFHSLCTDRKGLVRPHVVRLGKDEDGPEVELTAVRFSWQGESAGRTESDQYLFPGKHLALRLGLRKRAELPEFVDEAGDLAAMVMKVNQEGWSGHLLYLREDLLRAYCAERGGDWGWIVWGERTVRFSERKEEAVPDWVPPLRASGGGRFSRSMSLSLLSGR